MTGGAEVHARRACGVASLALAIACAAAWARTAPAAEAAPKDLAGLGQALFHDPILSRDRSLSCASCHRPERAYADDRALSIGIDGKPTRRNVPSVMNMRGRLDFFWDGRAGSLEEQALVPIAEPDEMDLPVAEAVARLRADPRYSQWFPRLAGGGPDADTLARALAAFQKTLETSDTPYDDYVAGDRSAMSASALRGRALFRGKALCLSCHIGEDFTSDQTRNIGLYDGRALDDPGRGAITGLAEDLGRFKVSGLRNIAITAPYMHNGMFATLREVIDYYDDPNAFGIASINRDPLLDRPLNLSEQEKDDLEAFLHALTDRHFAVSPSPTGNPTP